MKISVLINSRNRPQVLARCLDSVLSQAYPSFEVRVLDDASTTGPLADELAPRFADDRLHFTRVEETLGVARGRNLLMRQAAGDLFVIIDDDAVFADDQALRRLAELFRAHPGVGIVACKIIDHRDGATGLLVPFGRRALRQQPSLVDQTQLVSYFVGAGHALRRRLIEQCGGYSNQLTFGEEELDLSYRAIEAGFEICFAANVVVHHHPQTSVVHAGARKQPELYYHVQNRFFLARTYLALRYVPVYLAVWLARYAAEALQTGALFDYWDGLRHGLRRYHHWPRTPLGDAALRYLKANHGRLWY